FRVENGILSLKRYN
ncbi:hypothetical protein, partial [Clostridioides difficile]